MAKIIPTLCSDIDRGLSAAIQNPEFHLKRNRQGYGSPRLHHHIHSWLIEHPQIRRKLQTKSPYEQTKQLRSQSRKGAEKLKEAWQFLHHSQFANLGALNYQILLETGKIVNNDADLTYRDCNVTLNLKKFTPPNYRSVSRRLDDFFKDVNNPEFHTVERAAYTHLYIAGIQPFLDGNKRTSRLLQNYILYDHKIPTAHIPVGERELYLTLLTNGLIGSKLNGNEQDDIQLLKPFFEYIGGKVLTGIDRISGTVKEIKKH